MLAIDTVVPGFERALARMPGAEPAWRLLNRAADERPLPGRSATLVRLAVAQHAGGPYARWVMARLAARERMNAEDILLATAGSALDRGEAAVVEAAHAMASTGRFTETEAYRAITTGLGAEAAARLTAHVALALLACDVLDSAAPGRREASPSQRGA